MPGEPLLLKPRSLTEILDGGFRLYRENFANFLGAMSIIYIPVTLVLMGVTTWAYKALVVGVADDAPPTLPGLREREFREIVANYIIIGADSLLTTILVPLATGALTVAVSKKYLNEPVSISKSYGAVARIFWKYWGTVLLKGLLVGLGFICCIFPCFIFLVIYVFSTEVAILEGEYGINALRRSKDLVMHNLGNIIVLGLLIILIQVPIGLGVGIFSAFILPMLTDDQIVVAVVGQSLGQLLKLLLQPFAIICWILLYYDIRIRREGFDLEVLARAVGTAQPAAPPA